MSLTNIETIDGSGSFQAYVAKPIALYRLYGAITTALGR